MKVLCVIFVLVVACSAAPGKVEDEGKLELFSGVAIEKDASGERKLNVKFEPGELKEAARTFEEARGKIKKYSPLLAGIGMKVVAVLAVIFGGLTLLVTKALVMAKLAFLAASALGIHRLLGDGGLNSISAKFPQIPQIPGFQAQPQQWSAPTASAGSFPYARSSNIGQDGNDLAYKSQIPS